MKRLLILLYFSALFYYGSIQAMEKAPKKASTIIELETLRQAWDNFTQTKPDFFDKGLTHYDKQKGLARKIYTVQFKGQPLNLNVYKVRGKGECGFDAVGFSREEFINYVNAHWDTPTVKESLTRDLNAFAADYNNLYGGQGNSQFFSDRLKNLVQNVNPFEAQQSEEDIRLFFNAYYIGKEDYKSQIDRNQNSGDGFIGSMTDGDEGNPIQVGPLRIIGLAKQKNIVLWKSRTQQGSPQQYNRRQVLRNKGTLSNQEQHELQQLETYFSTLDISSTYHHNDQAETIHLLLGANHYDFLLPDSYTHSQLLHAIWNESREALAKNRIPEIEQFLQRQNLNQLIHAESPLHEEAPNQQPLDNRILRKESQDDINSNNGDEENIEQTTHYPKIIIPNQLGNGQRKEKNQQDIISLPYHLQEAEEHTPRTKNLKDFNVRNLSSIQITSRLEKILESEAQKGKIPTHNIQNIHLKALDVLINKGSDDIITLNTSKNVLSFMVNPIILSKNRIASKEEQKVMVGAIEKSIEKLAFNNGNLKIIEDLLFGTFDTLNETQKTHTQISYIIAAKAFGTWKGEEDATIFNNIKEDLNHRFNTNKFTTKKVEDIYNHITR